MAKTNSGMKFPFDDQLWGVERHTFSDLIGEVVCPMIRLWKSPKQEEHSKTAPHETAVSVLRRRRSPDGRWFYLVQAVGQPELRGWVWEVFLRKAGAIKI